MFVGDLIGNQDVVYATPGDLTVQVLREPYTEQFTLVIPNGTSTPYTELMEAEETRTWFTRRGCDPIKLGKALDYAWEFGFYRPCYIRVKTLDVPVVTTRVSPRL